jgi:hypothetical protein
LTPVLGFQVEGLHLRARTFHTILDQGVRKHFVVLDTDQPKRDMRAYLE